MQTHGSKNNSSNTKNKNKNKSSNSHSSQKSSNNTNNTGILNKTTVNDDDGNPASVMSNISSYSLIDDDHIDDQETINVGNLIIDLESDLEKEKIENEQAINAKPTQSTTTTATASSSTSFGAKSSNSTTINSTNNNSSSTSSNTKLNQKSSSKHSNNSINSSTNNSSNNNSTSNNTNPSVNNNNGHLLTSSRTVFKSSSDERGELKMRITRETKPGKSEHKIVTSPNQKSPTSCSSTNNNNVVIGNNNSNSSTTNHVTNCEDDNYNETISRPSQSSSSISSTKECGTSTSIGTITEPECLGPCDPGTSVTLEGIVWQETEGGILVVNVTWRGKTYVGALLDCTKHDWAPPRLCDSPASDIDSKTHKGVRTKRIVTRSNGIGLDEKNLLQTTGKLRNGKGRRILTSTDLASCNKRPRESEKSIENLTTQAEARSSTSNVPLITNSDTACISMNADTTPSTNAESISTTETVSEKAGAPNSPILIGCSEPNCSKKYRNMNGLLYHQAHAHGADNEANNAPDDNCSSSVKEGKTKIQPKLDDTSDRKEKIHDDITQLSPPQEDSKQSIDTKHEQERNRTPSPHLSSKINNRLPSGPIISPVNNGSNNHALLGQESRAVSNIMKPFDSDRRIPTNPNNSLPIMDHENRLPPMNSKHQPEIGSSGPQFSSALKSSSSVPRISNNSTQPQLPITTEEGMKPSGTSTGPPPAPHQANCYFNSAFLSGTNYNPFGISPYLPRPPSLPMFDQLAPPTSNAALLSRLMNSMARVPPLPDSPSRLLSPSMSKNLPFPPFKLDPNSLPVPPNQMVNSAMSNMPPLPNPPLSSNSPHLRLPSQVDPLMPPNQQQPFPPPSGMNPVLGLPVPPNSLGPMGGPQVPNLLDDPLNKQYPRRFN